MSSSGIILIIGIVLMIAATLALWRNPKTNPVARIFIAVIIFMSVTLVVTTAKTPAKPADHDHDGIADSLDPDDDNDGYLDTAEIAAGSNPFDAASVPQLHSGKMTITFIDVGQALSILIQDDQGNDLLYDGGNNADAPAIIATLQALHVDDLEFVIASHYHEDHIGGLDEVIENFTVDQIILPEATFTTTAYKNLMSAVQAENCPVTRYDFTGPVSFAFGKTTFTILGPLHPFLDDQNNMSLVLEMTYDTKTILLMGDADQESETLLMDHGYALDADILDIGHHGSRTSSSAAFIAAVTPQVGVISVGKDNSYGLPDEDVIARYEAAGTALYRTDLSGTVTLTIQNEAISVTTQK